MPSAGSLEYVLRKDRFIIVFSLLIMCVLSWLYIIYLYNQMYPMNMDALFFAMPMTPKWNLTDFVLLFLMWLVMMIAMMIPAVTPLVVIFALINRKRHERKTPFVPTGYLLSGYFLVWAAFSLFATLLQWLLQQVYLLSPEMITTNKLVGGVILILAGIFQFTPLKKTCLRYCRTPISFIHQYWQNGKYGAFRMGMQNGVYCLGCCWVLMLLLFVSGIMNILWIGIISFFVLVEKVFPASKFISAVAGLALIVYGVIFLIQ